MASWGPIGLVSVVLSDRLTEIISTSLGLMRALRVAVNAPLPRSVRMSDDPGRASVAHVYTLSFSKGEIPLPCGLVS